MRRGLARCRCWPSLIVCAVFLLSVSVPFPAAADWPLLPNVNVINNDAGGSRQQDPSVALAVGPDNTLFSIWSDYRWMGDKGMLSSSTDRGQTWGDGLRNNNDRIIGVDPSFAWPYLAADSAGTLYVTYCTESGGPFQPLYLKFMKSVDGGLNWGSPVIVDNGQESTIGIAPDGAIFVAYHLCEPTGCWMRLARSLDGGFSFSTVFESGDNGVKAVVRVDGEGVVYLTWSAGFVGTTDVFFTSSRDGGATFDPPIIINDEPRPSMQGFSDLSLGPATGPKGWIYAAWTDDRSCPGCDEDIYFSISKDGGASWAPSVRVDDGPPLTRQNNPVLTVDTKGFIHIVWADFRTGDGLRLRYARSDNEGQSFTQSKLVDADAVCLVTAYAGQIVTDQDDYLHLMWHDERLSVEGDIFYARSRDQGDTFEPAVHVCDEMGISDQSGPSVAFGRPGVLHIAWSDSRENIAAEKIYYARSTNAGFSFEENKVLSNGPSEGSEQRPDIAADSQGNAYIAWVGNPDWAGDPDIFFSYTNDGGDTFQPSVQVNDDVDPGPFEAYLQAMPAVACADGGLVFVVWVDNRDSFVEQETMVYFARSIDGGNTFEPNLLLSELDGGICINPDIAVGPGGEVFVVWQTQHPSGYYYNYLVRSDDNGVSFTTPPVMVNDTLGRMHEYPSISVAQDGSVYVAWNEARPSNRDIFVARSDDRGDTFGPSVLVNDITSDTQWQPSVAAGSNGKVFVAWTDEWGFGAENADISLAISLDWGATFGNVYRVNDDSTSQTQNSPAIAADVQANIGIVWADGRHTDIDSSVINRDIYFTRLAADGQPEVRDITVAGRQPGTSAIGHLTDDTPQFAWNFWHSDPVEIQQECEIEVNTAPAGRGAVTWAFSRAGPTETETYDSDGKAVPLADGIDYYVRIRVRDSLGAWSFWNEALFHLNAPPGAPLLYSPGDGVTVDPSTEQIIRWLPGLPDPEGDLVDYQWEVATDPGFAPASLIGTGTTTGLESDPVTTVELSDYYWRVKAADSLAESVYGNQPTGYWTFRTGEAVILYYVLRETITGPVIGRPPEIAVFFQAGLSRYEPSPLPECFTDPEPVLNPAAPDLIFYQCDDPAFSTILVETNRPSSSVDISGR